MKKIIALQITLLLIFAGSLGVLFISTDVYESVQIQIVETLCLSCVKLKPNTIKEYRFGTINDEPHPDFIIENLTKGPILLDYRITFCPGCDLLEENVLSSLFNYTYDNPSEKIGEEKPDLLYLNQSFYNSNIIFIHLNTNDPDSLDVPPEGVLAQSRHLYDIIGHSGNPMLVFITYGYNQGYIVPMYCTLYDIGSGDYKYDSENIKNEMLKLIDEAIDFYNEHKDAAHQ
jgi:hypothetical protein